MNLQQAGMFGLAGMAGIVGAKMSGRWMEWRGPWRLICLALLILLVGALVLWGFQYSLVGLVVGIILIDLGVFAAQVPNQVRVFAIEPAAQSRLNAVYMLFYYLGAALGAASGVQLMTAFGWQGVMGLTVALSMSALLLHIVMREAEKNLEPAA